MFTVDHIKKGTTCDTQTLTEAWLYLSPGVGPSPSAPTTARIQLLQQSPQFTPLHRKEIDEHTEGAHSAWSCRLDSFLFLVSSLSAQLVLYRCFDWLLMRLLNSSCYYTFMDGLFPVRFFSPESSNLPMGVKKRSVGCL